MFARNCVFVVDDDPSARRGLTRLLKAAGHDVRDFASGKDFLDSIDPEDSGCILLDLRMPEISLKQLYDELVKRGLDLSIIIITTDDDPGARQIARNINAVGFFRKPVDGTALLDAIRWTMRVTNGS